MPEIKPFRGLVYNPELPIEKLLAPPYDVISESERDELYKLYPYNVIRLILNKDEDRYESAKYYFDEWLKNGILIERDKEAVYVYEQSFKVNGENYNRVGIICLMKLEEFGKGKIFPHEKTFPKPKEDRFNLLKATLAQFDHIFGIYSDTKFKVENLIDQFKLEKLLFDFDFPSSKGSIQTGSEIRHKLYEITAEDFIENLTAILNELPVFIADGHHRYEVGLMFRDYMRSLSQERDEYNYILTYLTNMESSGLVILPTHRVLMRVEKENLRKVLFSQIESIQAGVERYFEIVEIDSVERVKDFLKVYRKGSFGVYFGGNKAVGLRIKERSFVNSYLPPEMPEPIRELDVTSLHEFIFRLIGVYDGILSGEINIIYTHDFNKAIELANEPDKVAFLLNPPSVQDVKNVSLSGATMPQKSTYFYPKLLSGIVMRKF